VLRRPGVVAGDAAARHARLAAALTGLPDRPSKAAPETVSVRAALSVGQRIQSCRASRDAMKTYSATPGDIQRGWYLIDAENLVLGRLAALVADRLRGKRKPYYSPNLDCGDHVVVVNAAKVGLTGNKRGQKTYYRHTGYPGGIKSNTARQILESAHPERVLEKAVQRMLPKGILGRKQIKKLHVYAGAEHPHQGQAPEVIDVAALNRKNSIQIHG
jgi:large subunit ribosomal protein L13